MAKHNYGPPKYLDATGMDFGRGYEDYTFLDQWGCWRECPVCNHVFMDIYDLMEERLKYKIAEKPLKYAVDVYSPGLNAEECPNCHPDMQKYFPMSYPEFKIGPYWEGDEEE